VCEVAAVDADAVEDDDCVIAVEETQDRRHDVEECD